MLSYLHAFHAGNYADIQKHAALYLALTRMQAKPAPVACFDTHAGSAVYDLTSERALKTGEAAAGIQAVWARQDQLNAPDWAGFIGQLRNYNKARRELQVYPGSPAWMAGLKRSQDSVVAFELHPTEGAALARWSESAGVRVQQEDGLKGLLKRLPPRAPRLLVLMDPSYEIKSDYQKVADTLVKAWRLCRHGVFLVWYPLLPGNDHTVLLKALKASPVCSILRSELRLVRPPARGMVGSGMLVVNPPWGMGERLTGMMEDVGGEGMLNARHTLDWLTPEKTG